MERSTRALAVFGRYPRRGQVKTRLGEVIGPDRALQLYSAFLLDTLDRALRLDVEVFLFMSDASQEEADAFQREHRLPNRLRILGQQGTDLGERMWNAYLELETQGYPSVVFIGSDTPTLPLEFIHRAFRFLTSVSVVVGPVEDGGYYLLGLSERRRELFQNVDWGTPRVLDQTVSKLRPHEFRRLPGWYDVDLFQDLRRLSDDVSQASDPPQRTGGLLSEWSLAELAQGR